MIQPWVKLDWDDHDDEERRCRLMDDNGVQIAVTSERVCLFVASNPISFAAPVDDITV